MTKNNERDYWKGVPEELKQMCLIEARGRHYCTQSILKYLADRIHDCETAMLGVTAMDYLKWVDRSMEMALYPVEFHEEDWKANTKCIERILRKGEHLLQKYAPEDYKTGYRTGHDDLIDINFIELAQHLDVYFCTLHMYKEEPEKLEARLDSLLEATKRNVKYLLSHEDADQFVESDDFMDTLDFHYAETDTWEPLQWVYRESMSNLQAMKLCVKTYEKYALFLQEKNTKTYQRNACMRLRYRAEDHLRTLCDLIIDGIKDELEYTDMEETIEIMNAEIEKYNKVIDESIDRDEKAIAEGDGFMYHQQNAEFTQKLRRLMSEHPTLPIVVDQLSDLACTIGYVCDLETGNFREEVIYIVGKDQKDRQERQKVREEQNESSLGIFTSIAEDFPF